MQCCFKKRTFSSCENLIKADKYSLRTSHIIKITKHQKQTFPQGLFLFPLKLLFASVQNSKETCFVMPLRDMAMTQSLLPKLRQSIRYLKPCCQLSNLSLKVKKRCVYLFSTNNGSTKTYFTNKTHFFRSISSSDLSTVIYVSIVIFLSYTRNRPRFPRAANYHVLIKPTARPIKAPGIMAYHNHIGTYAMY